MAMRLLLLCLGLLFAQPAYLQLSADSLLRVAEALPTDEARYEFLQDMVTGDSYEKLDNPVPLILRQIAIAKRQELPQKEYLLAADLISVANFHGQFGIADSFSFAYAQVAEQAEAPIIRVRLNHFAAKAAFFNQRYVEGIKYDSLALRDVGMVEDTTQRQRLFHEIHNYLGKMFNASGQFIPAVTVLNDGIEAFQPGVMDSAILLEMYTELGIVYSQIGLYERAVEYLDRQEGFSRFMSPVYQAQAQVNIGRNLLLAGKYSAAINRYLTANKIEQDERQNIIVKPYVFNGLIESYYRLNQVDSVNHYFKAFTRLLEQEEEGGINNFLYRQSSWLHAIINGRLREAEQTGLSLYQEALSQNDPADQILYTEFLADTYRKKGDYQQAEAYTSNLMEMKDSVQSANRNNALLLFYNQFETQEKEKEILRLDAERAQVSASRRLFQTVAGLLGLLLMVGGWFYYKLRSARQQLSVQNEELSQLNATKDRFFSIIAHDLRNPIAALETADNQVTTLYERGKTESVKRVVSSISQTAGRLNGLLDNLLKWALSQSSAISLKKTRLPLAEIIDDNFALYQPAADAKGIQLEHEVPSSVDITADRDALHTILRNLVGNAVKFSPSGSATSIMISHRTEGNRDIITVQDQGPGITPAVQAGLFRLNQGEQQEGRRKSGTGLGLILCKDLTELHGGGISVASEAGQGTAFSIWLPRD
ncbi:MAG: HAMP domain-containing sensor histidine kinase [Bacteroidota bacterium]